MPIISSKTKTLEEGAEMPKVLVSKLLTENGYDRYKRKIDAVTGNTQDPFKARLDATFFSENTKSIDFSAFDRSEEYMAAVNEYFNIQDDFTRVALLCVTEADQGNILTSLTTKLYQYIVDKADDIDYGDIPGTKGDITKLPNYDKIVGCIDTLKALLKEYKQKTDPVDAIGEALSNVQTRKDQFGKCFRYDVEIGQMLYNNTVLSIITGISFMISNCIEFIKNPSSDSFEIVLDKMALNKTKDNMIYGNIKKFNSACSKGHIDKSLDYMIKMGMNQLRESSQVLQEAIPVALAVGAATTVVVSAIVLNIIPILREMVYFFFYTRTRLSDFFDMQADLLQMNAYNLESNKTMDDEKKQSIIKKQMSLVDKFRAIANKLSIVSKTAEVKATKELSNTDRKLKYGDVRDELHDGAVSAIF